MVFRAERFSCWGFIVFYTHFQADCPPRPWSKYIILGDCKKSTSQIIVVAATLMMLMFERLQQDTFILLWLISNRCLVTPQMTPCFCVPPQPETSPLPSICPILLQRNRAIVSSQDIPNLPHARELFPELGCASLAVAIDFWKE